MKRLFRSEKGYVLVFSLLVLPVFVGFGLLIIDAGRGNNAHGDLQAAVDSVALAGARELDGGYNAIARAKVAMGRVENTVGMLSPSGGNADRLIYQDATGNEYKVIFLTEIPDSDSTLIDTEWVTANQTTDDADAQYVYVRGQSRDLLTTFFNPVNYLRESVPIAAVAVAKSVAAACDITPLYICNPFEYDASGNYVGDQLQQEFNAGSLHGRMIRLHPPGNETEAPGNFGFLRVDKPGTKELNDYFAGARTAACYSSERVQTQTGAATSLQAGINTRFDIYEGNYANSSDFEPLPAENVRKGAIPKAPGNGNGNGAIDHCVKTVAPTGNAPHVSLGDDHVYDIATGTWNYNGEDDFAYGFPDNTTMSTPVRGGLGASIGGSSDWDINRYFQVNYGADTSEESPPAGTAHPRNVTTSFPGLTPSRYDVYRAEIENNWHLLQAPGGTDADGNPVLGEYGSAQCGEEMGRTALPTTGENPNPDRRIIMGAVIDCGEQESEGGGTNSYTVNSYVSMFLTRPVFPYRSGGDLTIDVEIVDVTGPGGNGTLDEFIRAEAILVR
ncbi:Putative Flp pilus-assembly TadE/G-like [Thalassococcus halodurans]|uniref:Putative Flp pilus-assembly TadE/G-like n=1 Tax=Thalassococcus halodurans TaxID=373675 RepID=A0A1H6BPM3_9RHOB|nr:Tad domain-containing protein [Thalassococcus halodurans]SEG62651.1 Putative Flp pilus-assembly TadE/G-like [Thalassococcus halodurans]